MRKNTLPRGAFIKKLSLVNFVSGQTPSQALEHQQETLSQWTYVPSGNRAVVVGMPDGPNFDSALVDLISWCSRKDRVPLLFGVEPQNIATLATWNLVEIGRQPLFKSGPEFQPTLCGQEQPQKRRELRRQARRALSKGVELREVTAGELQEFYDGGSLDELFLARWNRHSLADFSFLVEPFRAPLKAQQRAFLAVGKTKTVLALMVLSPSSRGWLIEHQLLHPKAPNGTSELALCQLLSRQLPPGTLVSLGITPLFRALIGGSRSAQPPGILSQFPGRATQFLLNNWEQLYGFRRLLDFRRKLEPDSWEPVYWATPKSSLPVEILTVLRVFSGGSLIKFALATMTKQLQRLALAVPTRVFSQINLFYMVTLAAWIPVLWFVDGQKLFGHPQACKAWAGYDMILLAGFIKQHSGIPARKNSLATKILALLVLADTAVAWLLTLFIHGGIPQEQPLGAFLVLINTAPVSALLFLGTLILTRLPIHGRIIKPPKGHPK